MRAVVFAHRLELGGTQTNAIELAATMREHHDWDLTLFATPGPAQALARDRGLPVVPAPAARTHPSPTVARALRALSGQVRPDLIHAWDWPQCLDAYLGEHLLRRTPLLVTCMGMVVPTVVPRTLPVTFGTEGLRDAARATRRGPVELLEPPVDVGFNAPGVVDGPAFRRAHGIDPGVPLVAVVSRLEAWLKLESLRDTVSAVDTIARDRPVALAVVGDGSARDEVSGLAAAVNARHGRVVIVVTGPLVDPRPAYEAADVMVGMGGSALRSLAFGKPLVVLGERGFSRPFDRDTAPFFLRVGYYGIGDGTPGAPVLTQQLRTLLDLSAAGRAELGAFGRRTVVERYGLRAAAAGLDALYRTVAASPPSRGPALRDGVRTAALITWRKVPAPLRVRLRPPAPSVSGQEGTT